MTIGRVTYELFSKKGKGSLRLRAAYSEQDWQFALKHVVRLISQGHRGIILREIEVTHEHKPK